MNGNYLVFIGKEESPNEVTPHSLGKLIEWKPVIIGSTSSHSFYIPPHSLGKLIEWKHTEEATDTVEEALLEVAPHSLGKLIEWKLHCLTAAHDFRHTELPTRWGN